jgi:preprotein translocase subunit SecE
MPLSPSSRHLAQMTAAVMAVFIAMILATLLIDPYRVFGITGLEQ